MSVAEFIIAGSVSVPLLCAAHECVRLYSIQTSSESLLSRKISEAALSSLAHIQKKTFAIEKRFENSIEKELKNELKQLLSIQPLSWQWRRTEGAASSSTLLGVRTSIDGPDVANPGNPIQGRATLCVQSWLEPLIHVVNDGRSCVGEFLTDEKTAEQTSRGISLSISAQRQVPMTVFVYHFGIYENVDTQKIKR